MRKKQRFTQGLAKSRATNEEDAHEVSSSLQLGLESFTYVVCRARTYRQLGCGLAWLLVKMKFGRGSGCTAGLFRQMFFNLKAAGTRSFSERKRASLFPIREGSLDVFRKCLLDCDFETCFTNGFSSKWGEDAWTFLVIHGCNKMADTKATIESGPWSAMEVRAVDTMRDSVARRCTVDGPSSADVGAIEKELKSKRVGYSGEEIGTCQVITLEQVLPSLPPSEHGGSIDTLEWVSVQTKDFLLHPEKCLKAVGDIGTSRPPGRIHVKPEDQKPLADELIARNICKWIPLDEVVTMDGRHILNGLFGVEKSATLPSGKKVLRLIMNLVPSNEVLTQLQGTVSGLPSITSWQSTVLEGDEQLRLFQSDMSSAFYLFKLPSEWQKFLAFNLHAKGYDIGAPPVQAEVDFVLACNVIPRGWISSVSIMQEVSENLLLQGGLHDLGQVRRTKGLPKFMTDTLDQARGQQRVWWHVYLDNFAAAERLVPPDMADQGKLCHALAEQIWSKAGVVSSSKKRVCDSARVEELGAEINGEQKTVGGSTERFVSVIRSTLWLLSQKFLVKKWVQVVAGRWVFLMQFRRPTMSIFNEIWAFVSSTKRCSPGTLMKVRQELLQAIFLSPIMHSYLGAKVTDTITASDASGTGGAIGIGTELTPQGKDFTAAFRQQENRAGTIPVLVLSLFNGIGGAFRAYDVVGVAPVGRIAFDVNPHGNRVTIRHWPNCEIHQDVRSITPQLVQGWAHKYVTIEEIHIWGGFPCNDLSSAKSDRLNLEGPSSSLFWELPRILSLLHSEFQDRVKIKFVFENVASMDLEATRTISQVLKTQPYAVDCRDAVPMSRPRYAWCSEVVEGTLDGIEVRQRQYWRDLTAVAAYPSTEDWIEPGREWNGEKSSAVFPTCMKAIVRSRPPPSPAGLAKTDQATRERWASDSLRYPPYQYKEAFLITNPQRQGSWRLLSAVERELLLGYGYSHTRLCMTASEVKANRQRFEDTRCSLLGESFSIYSFCIFALALSHRFVPRMHYQHLANRMGMAPGFRAPPQFPVPLRRLLAYGAPEHLSTKMRINDLNRILLSRTDHTGADVRIVTGEVLSKKNFPRQAVSASWWTWRHVFKVTWQKEEHINALEFEAILLSVKYHLAHLHHFGCRIFHISDSFVCISIITEGRTGSLLLRRKLQLLNAHLLASNLSLVMAHVDSIDNPTDEASRQGARREVLPS